MSIVTVDTLAPWGFGDLPCSTEDTGLSGGVVLPILENAAGPRIHQGEQELINFVSCAPFGSHVDQPLRTRYGLW